VKPDRRLTANIALRGAAAGIALLVQVCLVRLLGADGYGSLIIFMTVCALLAIVACGGLDVVLVRRFAIDTARGNHAALRGALKAGLTRTSLLAASIVVLVWLGRLTAEACGLATSALPPTPWLLAGAVIASATTVTVAGLRGMKRFLTADFTESVIKPISMALVALAVMRLPYEATTQAQLTFIAGNLVALLCALWIFRRKTSTSAVGDGVGEVQPLPGVVESSTLTAYALVAFAFFQLDTLLVGMFGTPQDVGAYNMACNLVRLVIFLPLIIAARSQPQVAVLFDQRDYGSLRALASANLRRALLSALGAALLLALLGQPILEKIHDGFGNAYPALLILCVAHVINSSLIVLTSILLMCGLQRLVLQAQLAGLALCLPMYLLLIPDYGPAAAAGSVLVGIAVDLAALCFLAHRAMNKKTSSEVLLSQT